jgi:chemotaxis protein CheD
MIVGIGECRVSSDVRARLITYALGSCIAVVAWDPIVKVGGLLHFLLPDSTSGTLRGAANPGLFADTGIPLLLEKCLNHGAARDRLMLRAAGGAKVLDSAGQFDIGNRNHSSMRKSLSKAGLFLHAEATGGVESRSVSLEIATGTMLVREGSAPWRELTARRRFSATHSPVRLADA